MIKNFLWMLAFALLMFILGWTAKYTDIKTVIPEGNYTEIEVPWIPLNVIGMKGQTKEY